MRVPHSPSLSTPARLSDEKLPLGSGGAVILASGKKLRG